MVAVSIKTDEDVPVVMQGWIAWAADVMKQRGWNNTQLAEAAGCGPETITRLFQGTRSRWVPEIADALGIARPYVSIESRDDARWIEVGRRIHALDPSQFETWLGQALRLAEGLERVAAARMSVAAVTTPAPKT